MLTIHSGLEWLLDIATAMIREFIGAYEAEFGIVLPAAGTVLDMSRPLGGVSVERPQHPRDFAVTLLYALEAVDGWLRVFDGALMLRHCGLPSFALPWTIDHSHGLLKKHLELI